MVQKDGPGHAVAGYCRSGPGRERGHKPTPSQESNTLSEVSCFTTLSSGSDWAQANNLSRVSVVNAVSMMIGFFFVFSRFLPLLMTRAELWLSWSWRPPWTPWPR